LRERVWSQVLVVGVNVMEMWERGRGGGGGGGEGDGEGGRGEELGAKWTALWMRRGDGLGTSAKREQVEEVDDLEEG